jgi:hypothetical protein
MAQGAGSVHRVPAVPFRDRAARCEAARCEAEARFQEAGVQAAVFQPRRDSLGIATAENGPDGDRQAARPPVHTAGLNDQPGALVVCRTQLAPGCGQQAASADEHSLRTVPDAGAEPFEQVKAAITRTWPGAADGQVEGLIVHHFSPIRRVRTVSLNRNDFHYPTRPDAVARAGPQITDPIHA